MITIKEYNILDIHKINLINVEMDKIEKKKLVKNEDQEIFMFCKYWSP